MSSVPIVLQPQAHIPIDWQTGVFFALLFVLVAFATRLRSSFGVAAILALDPFALYRYVGETTVTIPKVVLLAVATGLLLGSPRLDVLRNRRISPVVIAAIGLVGATALTWLPSSHHADTLREVLKAAEYLTTFVVVLVAFASDPDERTVRWALVFSAISVIALAIVQDYTAAPAAVTLHGELFPRIAGPLEGPNQLAGYLEIVLPILLAWRMMRGARLLLDLTLIAGIFAMFLTFSRAGLAGIVLGIAAVLVAVGRPRATRSFAAVAAAAIIVFGLGFVTLVLTGHGGQLANAPLIGRTSDSASVAQSPGNFSGLGTRTELWRAAWTMWRAHPVLGIGAGNYELEIGQAGPPDVRTHANSLYLQALAEGGIVQLLAYLALLATVITLLSRGPRSPLTIGALGATLALSLHQVLDDLFFFPKVGSFWWAVIAIGLVSALQRQPDHPPSVNRLLPVEPSLSRENTS